ncbi:MAG: nucleotide exchange factor GrpE [Acidimicrobiales bacterium]
MPEGAEGVDGREPAAADGELVDGEVADGEVADGAAAAEEILTDVVALTQERDEYLAALQRSQADFANYRKRVLRQQEEQGGRAALDLVTKLLPMLDNLDLAVAHLDKEGDEDSTLAKTLRQTRAQLIETLAKEGLERVDAEGVDFDPSIHDAVAHAEAAEGDDPSSRVEEVLRSGYRWRGQTVRPAMVRVRG